MATNDAAYATLVPHDFQLLKVSDVSLERSSSVVVLRANTVVASCNFYPPGISGMTVSLIKQVSPPLSIGSAPGVDTFGQGQGMLYSLVYFGDAVVVPCCMGDIVLTPLGAILEGEGNIPLHDSSRTNSRLIVDHGYYPMTVEDFKNTHQPQDTTCYPNALPVVDFLVNGSNGSSMLHHRRDKASTMTGMVALEGLLFTAKYLVLLVGMSVPAGDASTYGRGESFSGAVYNNQDKAVLSVIAHNFIAAATHTLDGATIFFLALVGGPFSVKVPEVALFAQHANNDNKAGQFIWLTWLGIGIWPETDGASLIDRVCPPYFAILRYKVCS